MFTKELVSHPCVSGETPMCKIVFESQEDGHSNKMSCIGVTKVLTMYTYFEYSLTFQTEQDLFMNMFTLWEKDCFERISIV